MSNATKILIKIKKSAHSVMAFVIGIALNSHSSALGQGRILDNNKIEITPPVYQNYYTMNFSGNWKSEVIDDAVYLTFMTDLKDNPLKVITFNLKEFLGENAVLSKNFKVKIVRQAGQLILNGIFHGNVGTGTYQFVENKEFLKYISQHGVVDISPKSSFSLFINDVQKEYVQMLNSVGYNKIPLFDLTSLLVYNIDKEYITSWTKHGYASTTLHDISFLKALDVTNINIDSKQNLIHPSVKELIDSKFYGLTGSNFASDLYKEQDSGKKIVNKSKNINTRPEEIFFFRDSLLSLGLKSYALLHNNELLILLENQVTALYMLNLVKAGYSSLSVCDLVLVKSLQISQDYIRSFTVAINKILPINDIIQLKMLGMTFKTINIYHKLGFNNISIADVLMLHSLDITPEYVSELKKKGLQFRDINSYLFVKMLN